MNSNKIVSYVFGTISLLMAILLFTAKNIDSILGGILFLFISLIIYPTFDYLCMYLDNHFSVGRRVALGLGTFFLITIVVGDGVVKYFDIIIYVLLVAIFWFIMFVTNKKRNIEKIKKIGFLSRYFDSREEKRNARINAVIKYENEIKENFYNLDILTINAIASMVSESRRVHDNTSYNKDMPELSISGLIMSFCKDTQRIEDENELSSLYSANYYFNKITHNCAVLGQYIKLKIKESLPQYEKKNYILHYNSFIGAISEAMETASEIKLYKSVLSGAREYFDGKEIIKTDTFDYRYRDAFRYLMDVLATCTCIAKMIFVERKVKRLDENSEFYKILYNMSKELKNIEAIVNKSRPIYDEFYKSSLGNINDEVLYGVAITIIINKINSKSLSKKEEEVLDVQDEKMTDFETIDSYLRKWIINISVENRNIDINRYLLIKIIKTINIYDFDLYFKVLSMTSEYTELYYYCVKHNNKFSDKERYLKGDFEKEKKELSGKYSLNNITTGTQFELYLTNLFKDLGYKVKHNGKAGDQGADLILKKDDYIYVVQAKYYTGKLSNTPVQEITGALKYYNANQGVVITNSSFTDGAEKLAKANSVILIDGKDLKKLIDYTFEEEHDEDVLKKFEK